VVGTVEGIPRERVVDLFGQHVRAWGELTRNGVGQPLRLTIRELQPAQARTDIRSIDAWQLLGIASDWTSGLSSADYLREVRRG